MRFFGEDTHPLIIPILLSQGVILEMCVFRVLDVEISNLFSLINDGLLFAASLSLLYYVKNFHLPVSRSQQLFFIWLAVLYLDAIPDLLDTSYNYFNIKSFLTLYGFLYLIPVFMSARGDLTFYRQLFRVLFLMAFLYLILIILFPDARVEYYTMLAEGSIILLMTYPYHSKNKRVIIIVVIFLALIFMMLEARRNKVLYYGGAVSLALLINLLSKDWISRTKKKTLILLSLLLFVGLILAGNAFDEFFYRMSTGFDSREEIIELFVSDFNSSPMDWIWGRGLFGEFTGGILSNRGGLRDGIENGYLQLILKGGLVWVVLLSIISFRSIYLGFFKSNNLLCKGYAMIVLLYFVDMIGFGIPQISMKYIMIFIAMAGCNASWLRNCDDEFLMKEIGLQ